MDINRNNYEAFFLDYIEGKLSPAECDGLMAFLNQNPDLKRELDDFEEVTLTAEISTFENKNILKKNAALVSAVNDSNFEEYCIAKLEGDLNPLEEREFNNFLDEHPAKINDYQLYLKTLLVPDQNIQFELKNKLKHRTIGTRTRPLVYMLAAAASISIMVMVYKTVNNNNTPAIQTISRVDNIQNNVAKEDIVAKNNPVKVISKTSTIKKEVNLQLTKNKPFSKEEIKPTPDNLLAQASIEPKIEAKTTMQLAKINKPKMNTELIAERNKTKSSEYLSVKQYLFKNVKEAVDIDSIPIIETKDMDLWALAQSGIRKFNKAAGTNIKIDKETDASSNRTTYAFNSGLLGYYSSRDNK